MPIPAPFTLVTLKVGLPVKVVAPNARFATAGAVFPLPLLWVSVTAPMLKVPSPRSMFVAAAVVRPVLMVVLLVTITLLPKFPPPFNRRSKSPPSRVTNPLFVVPKAPTFACNLKMPPVTLIDELAPIKAP